MYIFSDNLSRNSCILSVALVSATLISIILTPNFRCISDIFYTQERGVFQKGGDPPLTAKLCRTFEVARFFSSYGAGKNHGKVSTYTAFKRFSCCLNKLCFFVNVALI